MKCLLSLFLIFSTLFSSSTRAQIEDEITVLMVALPGADISRATTLMNILDNNWPVSTGTSINFANGGNPVSLTSSTSGDAESQLQAARAAALAANTRNQHGADVLIFLTTNAMSGTSGTFCGWAPQENWTDFGGAKLGFNDPDNDGLDLDSAELWYAAIVSTLGVSCTGSSHDDSLLHEVAHLLGAGHEVNQDTYHGFYLFNDSHASQVVWYWNIAWRSVMHSNPTSGIPVHSFSGAGSTNNLYAINTTAPSVANYRRASAGGSGLPSFPAPPPSNPSCAYTPPTGITITNVDYCEPYIPLSRYDFNWLDSCSPEHDFYEVWYSQPDGQPYTYGWSTVTPNTAAVVAGANARVKTKSCNASGCSYLSSSSIVLIDGC